MAVAFHQPPRMRRLAQPGPKNKGLRREFLGPSPALQLRIRLVSVDLRWVHREELLTQLLRKVKMTIGLLSQEKLVPFLRGNCRTLGRPPGLRCDQM